MEGRHNPKDYVIRHLTTADLDQYNKLLRYAFQVTEQDLIETGWRGDEIKQSKFPVLERADVLGCFDDDSLVSQFAVYPLKMNIYSRVYPVGFVTSVCTYPEYSGKGIMKRLMYKSLSHMRERHQTFALLYPYSIPLYRKLGWEIISNKISYTVKDRQIPKKATAPGYVRRVDWTNSDFMHLHSQFAQMTHGCLFRTSLAWEEYWRWDEDDTVVAVYYSTDDAPKGYMVYLIKEDVMHIKEMIYLNREAQEGLWEYIRAHDSMIDEVRGNSYYNEPIAFEMDDGDIREMIRPYIMGRIVDVEGFIRGDELSTPKSLLPKPLKERVSRQVVYSDLDRNGHMNNARYLDWTQDLLPSDHHQEHPIKELTMCYINEALEGQNLDLNWEQDETGSLSVDIHRCKDNGEDYDRIFAAKIVYQ